MFIAKIKKESFYLNFILNDYLYLTIHFFLKKPKTFYTIIYEISIIKIRLLLENK